ncbi:helix-turn-helix domain-containing protein [Nocardia puris]|uniref:Helix-turn-helix protein n=2 Tax=Nocardia puris TaxID=208602 RepID=A0A366D0Q4_9NOCA|nr:helix-turn-helix domain-containing protein [Nocardia puris]RBO83089.1 hypothetical protein DFR74_11911 [Nocardia puris]
MDPADGICLVDGSGKSVLVGLLARYSKQWSAQDLARIIALVESAPRRRPVQTPPTPYRIARRLSPDTITAIVAAYQAGSTTPELCQRYGLSKGSLLKLLSDNGVTMRRQPLTNDQITQAVQLYTDGNSLRTIARQLGSSFSTIREALIAHGVTMRPARK